MLRDGVENFGKYSATDAAELAKKEGIRVYTVGAGTNGWAPIRFRGRLDQIPVRIDEKTLQAVAETTDGRYFRARDRRALIRVYREIDRLERSELRGRRGLPPHQHYALFVALALLFAAFAWLARGTVLRRLP